MKAVSAAASVAALAASCYAEPTRVVEARSTWSATTLPSVPSGCMTSYNGIHWGWLPDDMTNGACSIATLNADTGKKACFWGDYSHISSTSYDGSDITDKTSVVDGAIAVPAIMPDGVKWSQIDSALATKIGNAVKQFTNQGITVYLRFAHEMNYYAGVGTYPGGNDYADFITAWKNVANVCHGITGCYMFWCPNLQDVDSIGNWWPGEDYVDIIGVDHYPSDSQVSAGWASNYDAFYTQYVAPYDKPFLLGETGTTSSMSVKQAWVKALTMSDFSNYPKYQGAMWFEYSKGGSFYVVYQQSKANNDIFDENFE